jgi:copper homeostasis protein
MNKLEVIGFNLEGCETAQSAGAHRIELCDSPADGGTTPSYGFIKAARKLLSIDLFCMIRPRGGDFFYSDAEFEIMKTDIGICKQLGCDAVVFGILNADGTVDVARTKRLTELAYPMDVTFHRAFDRTNDPYKALEDIIAAGCTRILTSGLKPTAMEGVDLIALLIKKAEERIIIMPGSGIRSGNIKQIAERSGAVEFHSSARTKGSSKMNYVNSAIKEESSATGIDENEIKNMITELDELMSG